MNHEALDNKIFQLKKDKLKIEIDKVLIEYTMDYINRVFKAMPSESLEASYRNKILELIQDAEQV